MTDQNASPATPSEPNKDQAAQPGRDARKGAHDDGSTDADKEPPNHHGKNTHRDALGYYVERAPEGTPLSEIKAAFHKREIPDHWQAHAAPAESTDTDDDTAAADDGLPEIGVRAVHRDTPPAERTIGVVVDLDGEHGTVTLASEDELAEKLRGDRERRPRSWQSVPELASAATNTDVTTYSYAAAAIEVVDQ